MTLPINGISGVQEERLVGVCGLAICEEWPVAEAIEVYRHAISMLLVASVIDEEEPARPMTIDEFERLRAKWSRVALDAVDAISDELLPEQIVQRKRALSKRPFSGSKQ